MSGSKELGNIDHLIAQEYEIGFARQWVDENHDHVQTEIDAAANEDVIPEGLLAEFFGSSKVALQEFKSRTAGKRFLDIGCGPVPVTLYFPWAGDRTLIDPLASQYKELCDRYNPKWLAGVNSRTSKAEHYHSDLDKKIDGAIVIRNCIDHCEEPLMIMSNVASYAAIGCHLLFWADLFHLEGHNEGHTNITRNVDGFERFIENLGFTIIRRVPNYDDRPTLQYGCFAVKSR